MSEIFNITLNQVLVMFIFVAIGYIMRRKKIGGNEVSNVLSTILVYISTPALVFSNFAANFKIDSMVSNLKFFVAAIIVLIVTFFIAKFFAKVFSKNQLQKDVYMYSFLIPNIAYMGYPLVGSIFGEEILFNMMIYTLPYQFVIFTYGIYILNPKREFTFKKIFNPTIIAVVLGVIAGAFSIKLPKALDTAVTLAKNCISPIAMIMTGFVLASVSIKPLLTDIKLYLAALVRAFLIPGIILGVMLLFKVEPVIIVVTVGTLCQPMGLNSIIFPEAYSGDSLTGAKATFVSNIISIITIPIVFSIIGTLI